MASNKRLTDLTDYISVLPYASEQFGIYQPLIGWKSKRRQRQIHLGTRADQRGRIIDLHNAYEGSVKVRFAPEIDTKNAKIDIGKPAKFAPRSGDSGLLFDELSNRLALSQVLLNQEQWSNEINVEVLSKLLNGPILERYVEDYRQKLKTASGQPRFDPAQTQSDLVSRLRSESAMAGLLINLVEDRRFDVLRELFFWPEFDKALQNRLRTRAAISYEDPYLTFDPTKEIANVTLSPIGIVHLYRQFFFELDTFLGTPVGHVWLSPGSTVELIEVNTRRTVLEKIVETSLESSSRSERSSIDQDEISDAVKQENRSDTKLGFSTTVNQSWWTGSATASGSLNFEGTQESAREQAHKRMRQQTDKLSMEIRQNYKSTFKTITETTDTSSKRYVLSNSTKDLLNYEMRRKMRQVGVQIQDIGTYLCWETFVDDPGKELALPNLIHVAQPADMVRAPNPKHQTPPPPLWITFTGNAAWNNPDGQQRLNAAFSETRGQFVPLETFDISGIPEGYEVDFDPANPFISIDKVVIGGEDDEAWSEGATFRFKGMIN